jgi:hypothetical protein
MHGADAVALSLVSVKLLLIPLGIFAFLIFLLILGGLGLACALGLISLVSWLIWMPARRRGGRPSAHRSARSTAEAHRESVSSQSHPGGIDIAPP